MINFKEFLRERLAQINKHILNIKNYKIILILKLFHNWDKYLYHFYQIFS